MSVFKMDFVVYLEQLLDCKDLAVLPAPPDTPLSESLACRLWNACIKLQQQLESSGPISLLLDLCQIRKYCCTSLALHHSPEDMVKFWARTGKAYLDCEDTQSANCCLQHAEDCNKAATLVPPEAVFHLHKWSLELAVNRDGEIGNYVKLLCDLIPALPGERLGLCYFFYQHVATPLAHQSRLAHAATVLNACLALAAESPKRAEEVTMKARSLLCSLYLDLQVSSKASELLSLLPMNAATLTLQVKLLIQTDALQSFSGLVERILQEGPACSHSISDLLLSSNQLMDACRLLWAATQLFQGNDFRVKWAKALFRLVATDPSLSDTAEHLSTSRALEAVSGDCEAVLPFLWNLGVERSHAGDMEGSIVVMRKVVDNARSPERKHQALVLLAQNQVRLGQLEKALETLVQTTLNDGKPALLRLQVLLRMQGVSRDTVVSTFASLTTAEDLLTAASLLLEERNNLPDWPEIQSLVCQQLISVLQSASADDRLMKVIKFAVQVATDPTTALHYLQACADWAELDEEARDWLHRQAWNLAITHPPDLRAYHLLHTAAQLTRSTEQKQRCLLAACHVCFAGKLEAKYQEALEQVQRIPASDSLKREVEFEGWLVTAPATLAEYLERGNLTSQELKTAAGAAFRLQRTDLAAMCLKQLLHVQKHSDVAETAAVYRTLVTLAASAEESFCYAEQAVKLASERPYPRAEAEWLLALCWNSGIKSYHQDKLVWTERWLSAALQLVEKSHSAHSEQMRKVYAEVLRQRYDS